VSLIGSVSFAAKVDPAKQATLMKNIVKFAQSKVGQKVDLGQGGECTELVIAALKNHRGALLTHDTADVTINGQITKVPSYRWGTRILTPKGKLNVPTAGCIVQFEQCTFSKNGSSWVMFHHTAIVEKVSGTKVTLLHQNMEGDKARSVVRRDTIDFSGKKNGSYRVFKPNPL
jgi:hypothetical protein